MLDLILLSKFAVVLTVLYAGLNVHQLTSTHAYLNAKIEEFRKVLAETETAPGLVRLNLVFYVVLPLLYLILLRVAGVAEGALIALAMKFAVTAGMDVRSERRIIAGEAYTPMQHAVSRVDNVFNLAAAAAVVAVLLRPA
jgi:uncharacterized membrane protein